MRVRDNMQGSISVNVAAHLLLLAGASVLTFVFFGRTHTSSETFSFPLWDVLSSSTGCNTTLCELRGTPPMSERLNTHVSVPFMALSACLVGGAYELMQPPQASSRHVALGLLFAYSSLFVGLQSLWQLPVSQLIGVLVVVVVCFFHLGTMSTKAEDPSVRVLQPAIEQSLLAAAVLVACAPSCGFVALCCTSSAVAASALLCMALWYEGDAAVSWVFEVSIALTVTPVVVHFASAFVALQAAPLAPTWMLACAVIYLSVYLLWLLLHIVTCRVPEQADKVRPVIEHLLVGLKYAVVCMLFVCMLSISES